MRSKFYLDREQDIGALRVMKINPRKMKARIIIIIPLCIKETVRNIQVNINKNFPHILNNKLCKYIYFSWHDVMGVL
jgi:hypothetical protein